MERTATKWVRRRHIVIIYHCNKSIIIYTLQLVYTLAIIIEYLQLYNIIIIHAVYTVLNLLY